MPKRLVMVVHKTFVFEGRIINPGDRISDEKEIAFVRKHHPEKATASMHEFVDEPAVAESANSEEVKSDEP